jgi:hypothetical protein
MAFAKGRAYPILLSMAQKDSEAKKLLDNIQGMSQDEFEQEFGRLLGKHPELDNGKEEYKKENIEQFNSEVPNGDPKDETPLWKKVGAKDENDILFATKKIEKINNFPEETFERPFTKSRLLQDIDKFSDTGINGIQKTKDQYAKVRNDIAKWHPDNEKVLPSAEDFNKIIDKLVNEKDEKEYKSALRKSKAYPNLIRATEETFKQVKPIVDKKYEEIEKLEETSTLEISSSVEKYNGSMLGLDFRLKTKESAIDKIERDFVDYNEQRKNDPSLPEKTREQIANELSDLVRYTGVFEDNDFVERVEKTFVDIINKGYEYVKSKQRYFDNSEAKDINMKFKKNGVYVEVQFHTPTSFDIKMNKLHRVYELQRKVPKSEPLYKEMGIINKRISSRVANPKGVEKLTNDYFKELAGKNATKSDFDFEVNKQYQKEKK